MSFRVFKHWQLLAPTVVLGCGLLLPAATFARSQDPQPAPDNTKVNKDQTPPTADQQKMNPSDRAITQQIRKAIHEDTTLSTYAHNIKVVTLDGKVTLRGPVRSDDEKSNIETKAVAVAGKDNVTDQLTIAPAKQ
jgi:hyperosmotically inducible periplasmic protein